MIYTTVSYISYRKAVANMNNNFDDENMPKRVNPTYSNLNGESAPDINEQDFGIYSSPDTNTFDSGTATGSIILGILSDLTFWLPVLPLIFGIIGIFLYNEDKKRAFINKQPLSGTAMAGNVCSIIGIVFNLILYALIFFVPSLFAAFSIFSR